MSEFDREAERERLREKYERDQEKREATERMSELLLQGATMTNAHCSTCGDPIFRYDGQEFCATCERPVDRGDGSEDSDTGEKGTDAGAEASLEVRTPSEDARVQFGAERESGESESAPSTEPTSAEATQAPAETGENPAPARPAFGGEGTASDEDSIEATRQSLRRTLRTYTHQAEAADDPTTAREYLATAREAAEVLAVLRSR